MSLTLPFDDGFEPPPHIIPDRARRPRDQMYGHHPHQDEPDPRPLPVETVVSDALAGVLETFAGMLGDTRLELDLDDLLWSFVSLFHRVLPTSKHHQIHLRAVCTSILSH